MSVSTMLPSAVNVARPEIAIGIGAEVGVKLICQDPAKDGVAAARDMG